MKLPVNFLSDWFVEFRLTASSRLSVADEKRSSIKSCERKGATLAIEVKDIEIERENLNTIGLKPTAIKKHPWNAKVFYIVDPEGHHIEIWQSK